MQNGEEVTLRYSLHELSLVEILQSLSFLVILFSIFFGVLIGGFGDLYRRFQLKRALRQSQKTIERLEKEVQTLQGLGSIPLLLSTEDE